MQARTFWKAIAMDKTNLLDMLLAFLREQEICFSVKRFPHSLNRSLPGSDLPAQIQTDERYRDFVRRASLRAVLGIDQPIASLPDVSQGKTWAAPDPEQRGKKTWQTSPPARNMPRFARAGSA